MFDYTLLETLAAVLRSGSFDAAAARLHVTQSAVSQRIKQLEDRVGTPLVKRGHPCSGTETGNRLVRHLEDVALLETQLGDALPRPAPRLRIAVNADSLATWVLPAFAALPDFTYDIVVDDQDHSAEWLKRGDVSAAITAHATPPQGCQSTPLGDFRYIACASPDFLRTHFPNGVTAANLATAPCLVFNSKDNLQDLWVKANFGHIHIEKTHFLPSTQAFVDAAILGLGWGMNPEALVRHHLAEGRLQPVLPEAELRVALYWQNSRLIAKALAPLRAEICKAAAQGLQRQVAI